MKSIKELAQEFEPITTKNITELEKVSVNIQVYDKTIKQGTPDEFKIKVAKIGEQEYKIPLTVIADLKAILDKKPGLEHFAVSKSGSGINTTYTTIPL